MISATPALPRVEILVREFVLSPTREPGSETAAQTQIIEHGLTGLRHYEMRSSEPDTGCELSAPQTSVRIHSALLRDELSFLAEELHRTSIAQHVRVIKGAAVESLFYFSRGTWRQFSDIDVWVPGTYIGATCKAAE